MEMILDGAKLATIHPYIANNMLVGHVVLPRGSYRCSHKTGFGGSMHWQQLDDTEVLPLQRYCVDPCKTECEKMDPTDEAASTRTSDTECLDDHSWFKEFMTVPSSFATAVTCTTQTLESVLDELFRHSTFFRASDDSRSDFITVRSKVVTV